MILPTASQGSPSRCGWVEIPGASLLIGEKGERRLFHGTEELLPVFSLVHASYAWYEVQRRVALDEKMLPWFDLQLLLCTNYEHTSR